MYFLPVFANNKTIKFSTDFMFIDDRVSRTEHLDFYIPEIRNSSKNFYTYDFVEGEVFSKKVTGKKFEYLLSWLDEFWKPITIGNEEHELFFDDCLKFYRDKTVNRIELYYRKFYNSDFGEMIPELRRLGTSAIGSQRPSAASCTSLLFFRARL